MRLKYWQARAGVRSVGAKGGASDGQNKAKSLELGWMVVKGWVAVLLICE